MSESIRISVVLTNGWFATDVLRISDWTHVVINYIGSDNGEGIHIYYDGVEAGSDTSKFAASYGIGDSRIVIGRLYTDRDERYASVELDELMFFNVKLTNSEIIMLSQFWLVIRQKKKVIIFLNFVKNLNDWMQ